MGRSLGTLQHLDMVIGGDPVGSVSGPLLK